MSVLYYFFKGSWTGSYDCTKLRPWFLHSNFYGLSAEVQKAGSWCCKLCSLVDKGTSTLCRKIYKPKCRYQYNLKSNSSPPFGNLISIVCLMNGNKMGLSITCCWKPIVCGICIVQLQMYPSEPSSPGARILHFAADTFRYSFKASTKKFFGVIPLEPPTDVQTVPTGVILIFHNVFLKVGLLILLSLLGLVLEIILGISLAHFFKHQILKTRFIGQGLLVSFSSIW